MRTKDSLRGLLSKMRKLRYRAPQRAISSVGRAVRLHRKGRGFKSLIAHQPKTKNRREPVLCFSLVPPPGIEPRSTA